MTSADGSLRLLSFDFSRVAAMLSIVLLLGWHNGATAGKYNRIVEVGDKSPTWTGLPSATDETLSLESFADKHAIAMVFISQDCPIAKSYEQRLKALADEFSEASFALIAVNVNKGESLEQMKEYADEQSFNFPYLRDDSQKIAKQLGATCTPHAFVLNVDRTIVYMGAIDDHWQAEEGVKTAYLRNAIVATLAGRVVETAETKQVGCAIRWSR